MQPTRLLLTAFLLFAGTLLAAEDPAVKAGRLEVVSATWYFQKGALAFPLATRSGSEP